MTHQKKPHPQAAIMKAYADDTNLRVLSGYKGARERADTAHPAFIPESDYFLCLPKHKDAVLNMLNGGEVQVKTAVDWAEWLDVAETEVQQSWHPEGWYMCDDWQSRVKPKKQKRWIGVFRNDNGLMENTEFSYESIEELKISVYAPKGFEHWQFIEIEVEV